jgi:hypothetical protein
MVELNQLRVLQNNLHKNKERTYAVLNDPSIKDYAVLMLQEQYWSTYTKSSLHHHAWTLIEPSTYDTQPRSAIYVNTQIISPSYLTPLPIPIDDITAVEISYPERPNSLPSLFINIYNASGSQVISEFHSYVTSRKINPENYEYILINGDFNLHHPLWNPVQYHRHDEVADILIDAMSIINLNLLLPPGTVTFPNAGTTIDLVWGNPKVERALICCKIADEDVGSDHLPIRTEIEVNPMPTELPSLPYNFEKTDWEALNNKLADYLPSIPTLAELEKPEPLDE